jgi:ribosomal protein L16 Arg81 hydroxylase
MTDPGFSFEQLIRTVGCRDFFRTYWQRRSLSLELDKGAFSRILAEVGPLDIFSMAKSAQEGVQAWISSPHMLHSVFDIDVATVNDFHRINANLYFVGVPLPGITNVVADALGAPRRRVKASLFLTSRAGGASPHFDCNENFTIQLTGTKRWFVESELMAVMPMEGHVIGHQPGVSLANLIVEEHQTAERRFKLKPGTFLYVPRGAVHRTSADTQSWSLNISYAGTTWVELLQNGLRQRLVESARWRSTVTGASGHCEPEAGSANIFPELIRELRVLLDDPREVENLCRSFLETPGRRP